MMETQLLNLFVHLNKITNIQTPVYNDWCLYINNVKKLIGKNGDSTPYSSSLDEWLPPNRKKYGKILNIN
jgi:hypothetical protein